MKRLMAVAQLALCIVFVFCNNGDGQTRPSGLVGQWVDGEVGAKKSMELFKDGTGLAAGVSISWKTENNRFIISNSFGATAFNYKMSGYLLILSLDDEEPDTLVRKEKYAEFKAKREAEEAKKVAEAEAVAKKVAEKAKASISTFKDNRDGKSYKKVTIIDQTWMAENLNYAAEGSKCYDNKDENCAKYGRLYDWSTALKACPAGFHLPTDDEWTALENAIGGSSTAGTKLKSTSGWNKINENGNGTDDYGEYAKFPFYISHCVVKSMTYVAWLTPLFMKKRISITTNYYLLLRFVVAL